MKKILSTIALTCALGMGVFGINSLSYAEEEVAPATETTAAPAEAAPAAEAPAAEAAAPAPTLDTGSTAWMITATVLVVMMAVPGLALFYGGLVRTKNMFL